MKKILYIIFFSASILANAQVTIGNTSTVNTGNVLLSFEGNTATDATNDATTINTKGIILPAAGISPNYTVVNPLTNNPNNGTFLFDKTTKMIRMFENGAWKNFSSATGDDSRVLPNTSNETGTGVIIGSNTSAAKGVLVLESPSKALVLPHIQNPHLNVKSPYTGMMCYDTASNTIAIFDGVSWNYWR